jgi:hypothetical protein
VNYSAIVDEAETGIQLIQLALLPLVFLLKTVVRLSPVDLTGIEAVLEPPQEVETEPIQQVFQLFHSYNR